MAEPQIKFEDGAAYERMMGVWSQTVGSTFLDWLAPGHGLHWVDVGCGNGAFTELAIKRCTPASVKGIDPSEGQLKYARSRLPDSIAEFRQGDAMSLPFADNSFDIAVMALVLFFVPDPARGLAEMVRVVRPSGTIAVYVWDMLGGGFPNEPMRRALVEMGLSSPNPPSAAVSRMSALNELWDADRFEAVDTKVIKAERRFSDFNDYWMTNAQSPAMRSVLPNLSANDIERLKVLVRKQLSVSDDTLPLVASAHANAIKGQLRG